MRKMKDSGIEWIGKIPQNWNIERLQFHIYEINIKNSPIQTDNVLSLTNKLGVIPYNEKGNQGNKAKENYAEYKIALPDTIVVNSMNVLIGSVGISKYFGCVSPVYYIFNTDFNTDLRFINYIMQTVQFQKELRKYANGILEIRLRVSSSDILKRPIAIPNKVTQVAISDFLDRECAKIDETISKTKFTIKEYKKLKQSVITEAVTKGLNPDVKMNDSRYDFIGKIPELWEICRLKNIGTLQNGISKGGEFFGKGYPFVNYGDVYRNYALPESVSGLVETTEAERNKYSVEKGDIFFTRTSETIEEVGFSCVCEKTILDATFSGFVIRARPFNSSLVTGYAKYYFRSNHNRFYLVKEMNLVTRASLGQDLLKSMPVLIPPKEEQQQISDFLDKKCAEIDSIITKNEQIISELDNYKKSIIYEYVTGKKEV